MYDNDYIVLIDENGQPYIAHDWRDRIRSAPAAARNAVRTAGRRAVKYIEKIGNRYFYDADELKAYYENLRKGAKRTYETAKNKATSAYKSAKKGISTGIDRAQDIAKKAYSGAKDASKKAIEKAKIAYEAAKSTFKKYGEMAYSAIDNATDEIGDRAKVAAKTISEYADTKLDDIKDFAVDTYVDARNTARDAGGRVKEAASDAVDWARNVPTNVSNTVANNRALAEYKKLDKMNPDDMTQEEYNRWIGYQFRFGNIK